MKRWFCLFVVAMFAGLLALPAAAQTPSDGASTVQPTAPAPMSGAEAKSLQRQIDELRGIVAPGVAAAPAPAKPAQASAPAAQPAAPAAAPSSKWADVADKALDRTLSLLEDSVTSVSDALKKVAPEVWRIMIRQQYAKAAANLIIPWGLFVIGLIAHVLLKKYWKKPEDKDYDVAWWVFSRAVPVVWMIGLAIIGFVCLADAIQYIVNPQYYALRDLVQLIINKGQMQ
jgi:hypothetical protein